jgi:hypothetical protein
MTHKVDQLPRTHVEALPRRAPPPPQMPTESRSVGPSLSASKCPPSGTAKYEPARLPPMPPSAPTRSRMLTPRLGLPPPRAQSDASRHTSTHVGTRPAEGGHRQGDGGGTERAVANALSVTRDALSVTRHPVHFKTPCLFWGSLSSVRS